MCEGSPSDTLSHCSACTAFPGTTFTCTYHVNHLDTYLCNPMEPDGIESCAWNDDSCRPATVEPVPSPSPLPSSAGLDEVPLPMQVPMADVPMADAAVKKRSAAADDTTEEHADGAILPA